MNDSLILIVTCLFSDQEEWEIGTITLSEMMGGQYLPLNQFELDRITEAVAGAKPIKKDRFHKITLKLAPLIMGYPETEQDYYSVVNVELDLLNCLQCGAQLSREETALIDEHEGDPFCGQNCAEHWHGIVPGSKYFKVLKDLTFAARTSGGTSGPDKGLQEACERAEDILQTGLRVENDNPFFKTKARQG